MGRDDVFKRHNEIVAGSRASRHHGWIGRPQGAPAKLCEPSTDALG